MFRPRRSNPRAHLDAVHGFAANAAVVDDIGQLSVLSADRSGELIRDVRPRGARLRLKMDAEETSVVRLHRYAEAVGHPRADGSLIVESQYVSPPRYAQPATPKV